MWLSAEEILKILILLKNNAGIACKIGDVPYTKIISESEKVDEDNIINKLYEKIEKDELIVMFYSHAMIDLYDRKKHKNSSYLISNKILHGTKIYELRFTDYNLNMNSCKENFIKSTLKNKWLDWFEKV